MPKIDLSTRINVAGQAPVDFKLWFGTKDDMIQNISTKAFSFFEGMFSYCVETNSSYRWRERKTSESESSLLENDFVYPNGAIYEGVDYSNRSFNFFLEEKETLVEKNIYEFKYSEQLSHVTEEGYFNSFQNIKGLKDLTELQFNNVSSTGYDISNFFQTIFGNESKIILKVSSKDNDVFGYYTIISIQRTNLNSGYKFTLKQLGTIQTQSDLVIDETYKISFDVLDLKVKTSELQNDGNGIENRPFITLDDLPDVPEYDLTDYDETNERFDLTKDNVSIKTINLKPSFDKKVNNQQETSAIAERVMVWDNNGNPVLKARIGVLTNVEFIDTEDADSKKDSLRFTFQDGQEIITNVNELFDIGAFKAVSINTGQDVTEVNKYQLKFETLGGTINSVDLKGWFDEKLNVTDLQLINASNLIIGGVGATINTKALLAQKFTFAEADIANMLIVNNNVYATITNEDYNFNFSAFRYDTNITFFEEKDGFIKDVNSSVVFDGCTSLKEVKILCEKMSNSNTMFRDCSSLSPSKIFLPRCKEISAGTFVFSGLKADGTTLLIPELETIGSTAEIWFGSQNQNLSVSFPKLKFMHGKPFTYSYDLQEVYLPSLEICGATVDAVGGGFQTGDGVFTGILFTPNSSQTETKFYINRKLQTVNNGEPDTDIGYLILQPQTTVTWVGQNPYLELQNPSGVTQIILDMPSKLKLKGGIFSSDMWEVAPLRYNTVFLKSNGNDATAEENNPSSPFATLDAVVSFLATTESKGIGWYIYPLDNGVYSLTTNNNDLFGFNIFNIYSATISIQNFISNVLKEIRFEIPTGTLNFQYTDNTVTFGDSFFNSNIILYQNVSNVTFTNTSSGSATDAYGKLRRGVFRKFGSVDFFLWRKLTIQDNTFRISDDNLFNNDININEIDNFEETSNYAKTPLLERAKKEGTNFFNINQYNNKTNQDHFLRADKMKIANISSPNAKVYLEYNVFEQIKSGDYENVSIYRDQINANVKKMTWNGNGYEAVFNHTIQEDIVKFSGNSEKSVEVGYDFEKGLFFNNFNFKVLNTSLTRFFIENDLRAGRKGLQVVLNNGVINSEKNMRLFAFKNYVNTNVDYQIVFQNSVRIKNNDYLVSGNTPVGASSNVLVQENASIIHDFAQIHDNANFQNTIPDQKTY